MSGAVRRVLWLLLLAAAVLAVLGAWLMAVLFLAAAAGWVLLGDRMRSADLPPSPATPRVLVVEDNAANRFYAEVLLRRLRVRVDAVATGEAALHAVRHHRYDVVLMDVGLPGMDGAETTRALRSRVPPHLQPRVFAVSGDDRPETRRRLREAGMDGALEKPLRADGLLEAVGLAPQAPAVPTWRDVRVSVRR